MITGASCLPGGGENNIVQRWQPFTSSTFQLQEVDSRTRMTISMVSPPDLHVFQQPPPPLIAPSHPQHCCFHPSALLSPLREGIVGHGNHCSDHYCTSRLSNRHDLQFCVSATIASCFLLHLGSTILVAGPLPTITSKNSFLHILKSFSHTSTPCGRGRSGCLPARQRRKATLALMMFDTFFPEMICTLNPYRFLYICLFRNATILAVA